MLFPKAGGKQVDLKGGVGIDPLEHINQVRIGIDTLQATRGDQALDHADVAGTHLRPTEEPCFAAHGNGPDLALQVVGIKRDVGIFQKHPQGGLALQRIVRGFGKGIGGQQHLLAQGALQPGKEGIDHGPGIRGPKAQQRLIRELAFPALGLVVIELADEVQALPDQCRFNCGGLHKLPAAVGPTLILVVKS